MAFTHLHVHTEFSLLDGSSKIKEIAVQAKKLGFDSLAITDHGVMYGVIDFYRACKDAGIKPIIGCEIYVSPGSRFDREKGHDDFKYFHLVLLAENDIGYHNLMKIVSVGFTEGYYYKPRVDYETLEKYHEGIIALSASIDVDKCQDMITICVKGSGFLYNMVRIIAGTLIQAGIGAFPPEHVKEMLEALDRQAASQTAPARGLRLVEIQYEEDSPGSLRGNS